ncbi:MAG: TlpA family protein disulfide reductase [Chloroflexi bacterium]|nr:TlpA family protein disulfide reductase [Chloroflexota bacterium]
MTRLTKVLVLGIATLALLAAACGGGSSAAEPEPGGTGPSGTVLGVGPEVGKLAPSFTLGGPSGFEASLSDYRGKPLLINFWATWCGPCKTEMPHLQEAQNELGSKGLTVLLVDLDESERAVTNYLKDLNITMPTVIDKGLKMSSGRYGVFGLPTTFFVDERGVITYIKIGPFLQKQELLDKIAEKLKLS